MNGSEQHESATRRTLDAIATEYERAEISVIWLYDRGASAHTLLFAVAELCPTEQPRSGGVESTRKDGEVGLMQRAAFDLGKELYAARIFLESPLEALRFYRGAGGRRTFRPENADVDLRPIEHLTEEAPNEVPILAVEEGSGSLCSVLPTRPTAMRVCSHFADGFRYFGSLGEKQGERLAAFARRSLQVDLGKFSEHVGAVHLCMSNPLIRALDERLAGDGGAVLFEFYERLGQTVSGSHLQLTDHRESGIGFDLIFPVDTARLIVPIPCSPRELETRLYNRGGELLELRRAPFLRSFSLEMGLIAGERRIETARASGQRETHIVPTVTWDLGRRERTEPTDPPSLLAIARNRRNRRETGDTFHFFEGGPASRDRARRVIRDLIGKAKDRCMLCDPYLTASDVGEYAPFATTRGLRIRLLGSKWHLLSAGSGGDDSSARRLRTRLNELSALDPSLVLDCRVLLGRERCPVHDRFLMLDDRVFVLGSSLNEFGSRATTLYCVPSGPDMAALLESWWNEPRHSIALSDWLNGQPLDSGGGDP